MKDFNLSVTLIMDKMQYAGKNKSILQYIFPAITNVKGMKLMRKAISLIFGLAIVCCSFTGCGNNDSSSTTETTEMTQNTTNVTAGENSATDASMNSSVESEATTEKNDNIVTRAEDAADDLMSGAEDVIDDAGSAVEDAGDDLMGDESSK